MKTIKERLEINQKQIFEKAAKKKVFAIFSSVGSGKSYVALQLINKRIQENKVNNILWISLKSLIKGQIQTEINKWYPYLLEKFQFINIEKIARLDKKELDNFCKQFNINEKTYLVLDESLKIKNPKAKSTKFLLLLSKKVNYKLILNGTPISKNIADLYTQIKFLDERILNYKNHYDFICKHFEFYKYMSWKILKVHNLDYLKRQIEDYVYDSSLNKNNLPIIKSIIISKNDNKIIEAEKKWQAIWEKIKKSENFITYNEVLINFNNLYLTSEKSFDKLNAFKHIINSKKPTKQIIIMCRFIENIINLKTFLGDKAIVYYGNDKDDLELFKSKQVQYLIMGIRVGSFGIDGLQQNCYNMIFYDYPVSIDEIIQSTGRINRFGQTKDCNFYQIEIRDSEIKKIIKNLVNKKNNQWNTLNKTIKEVILETLKKENKND